MTTASEQQESLRMERILIIAGNSRQQELLKRAFTGYDSPLELVTADSAEEGLRIIERAGVNAVILDDSPVGMSGEVFLRELSSRGMNLPVIVLHGPHNGEAAVPGPDDPYEWLTKDEGYLERLPRVYAALRKRYLFDILTKSQRLWQETFDAISDYVLVIDESSKIIKCNLAFAKDCGMHPREIVGMKCQELHRFGTINTCISEQLSKHGSAYTEEVTCDDKVFLASGFPVTLPGGRRASVHILKDITEMYRLKEKLYHSDKLASLGLLVSGVAHELNNSLTGVLGYTELLKRTRKGDGSLERGLEKIYSSAERCKKIVENLLYFSGKRPPQRGYIQINELIDSTIALREYWLRSNSIKVIRDYGDVPLVHIDTQQMQQVLMNILVNAEYAITEADREERSIRFHTFYIEEKDAVAVEISDNGTGIPDDILPRIFDPFFTTKPLNKGSGLGLSISHGIVKEHNGNIIVRSSFGEGTTFCIELPRQRKAS